MKRWSGTEKAGFWIWGGWAAANATATACQWIPSDFASWEWLPRVFQFILIFFYSVLDSGLVVLSAYNTHVMVCRHWGIGAARRWGIAVVAIFLVALLINALTGWPMGSYGFTGHLGARIGGILPLTGPFLWYVLLTQVLFAVKIMRPEMTVTTMAMTSATGLVVVDWLMEPYASRIKAWWLWDSGQPFVGLYPSLWVMAFLCVWKFSVSRLEDEGRDFRPFVMLGFFVVLFAGVRWLHGV